MVFNSWSRFGHHLVTVAFLQHLEPIEYFLSKYYFSIIFPLQPIFYGRKKAPVVRPGLSKFGRHKQTRTADLYHVKVAL